MDTTTRALSLRAVLWQHHLLIMLNSVFTEHHSGGMNISSARAPTQVLCHGHVTVYLWIHCWIHDECLPDIICMFD